MDGMGNWLAVDLNMYLPSLKLTCSSLKNGWLEFGIRSFPIGFRPIFRGEVLVSGRVAGG